MLRESLCDVALASINFGCQGTSPRWRYLGRGARRSKLSIAFVFLELFFCRGLPDGPSQRVLWRELRGPNLSRPAAALNCAVKD